MPKLKLNSAIQLQRQNRAQQNQALQGPVNTNMSDLISQAGNSQKVDTFEKPSVKERFQNWRLAQKTIKEADGALPAPTVEVGQVPWPALEFVRNEEDFIDNPTVEGFLALDQSFNEAFLIVGHEKFTWLSNILIPVDEAPVPAYFKDELYTSEKTDELEEWHAKEAAKFNKATEKAQDRTEQRHQKIEKCGPGYGGRMTQVINKAKEGAFFHKNNLTIRGNIFKLTHRTHAKNVHEIMPRFGYRKAAHVGVRIPQFALNGAVMAVGFGFIPFTFGGSLYVANQVSNAIYMAGEGITLKVAGAQHKKIATHVAYRAAELCPMRAIPLVGDFIYYIENGSFGTAAIGIVATTIAESVMKKTSIRYCAKLNLDDLGDSRCLFELNQRIDYLSKFLLPYGQYLLLKEENPENQVKLRAALKTGFKTLRQLEKDKVRSLYYYVLALTAEELHESRREEIQKDCMAAMPDTRVNTHKKVRACLAWLNEHGGKMVSHQRQPGTPQVVPVPQDSDADTDVIPENAVFA